MKNPFRAGVCAWGLWLCATAAALPAPERFLEVFRGQSAQLTPLPADVRDRAAEFDYVFIGGFVGEYRMIIRTPFKDVKLELIEQRVPVGQIHMLQPSSTIGVEENAAGYLTDSLQRLVARTTRPLVIVAHSKGGLELLTFALNHPDFVEKYVDSIYLIQGPFGGSPIANYVTGDRPGTQALGWGRATMSTVKWILTRAHGYFAGVDSLRTEVARQRQERWFRENREAMNRIAPRVVFVKSRAERSEVCVRLRPGWALLRAFGSEYSDGTVPFDSQSVEGFPSEQVVLEGIDHTLVCPDLLTLSGTRRARALARAVVSSVGRQASVQ